MSYQSVAAGLSWSGFYSTGEFVQFPIKYVPLPESLPINWMRSRLASPGQKKWRRRQTRTDYVAIAGPIQGQAVTFVRYFPETVQPAIDRYINESRRLYEVLDGRLAESEYLAREYSIADIANYSWVRSDK